MGDPHGPRLLLAVREDLVEALEADCVGHLPVGADVGDLDVEPEVAVVRACEALGDPPEGSLQLGPTCLVRAPCAEQAHWVTPRPEREPRLDIALDERGFRLRL